MRKIVIFGNSGSGKSILAKRLSSTERLAHLDLDTIAWKPGSPPQRKSAIECRPDIESFVESHTGWIIEGCYSDLLEMALTESSEVIFMDLPTAVCIENASKRPFEPHKYESKQAQASDLQMLIDWIAQYDHRDDDFSRSSHLALYEAYAGKKTRITRNESGV